MKFYIQKHFYSALPQAPNVIFHNAIWLRGGDNRESSTSAERDVFPKFQ